MVKCCGNFTVFEKQVSSSFFSTDFNNSHMNKGMAARYAPDLYSMTARFTRRSVAWM